MYSRPLVSERYHEPVSTPGRYLSPAPILCPRGDLNSRDSGHIGQHRLAPKHAVTSQNRLPLTF